MVREGLLGPLEDPFGAGEGGDLVGLFELVGDDRAGGAGESVGSCRRDRGWPRSGR